MTASLSILNRFRIFFTGRFLGKFSVKWMSTVPPHLAYVAALPCETLMPAKQAVKDKLQGSVATYLRCGGVINNQIKIGLLLSLRVKKNFLRSYKVTSKNVIVSCTCAFGPNTAKDGESVRDNHVLACNLAKYSPFKKINHRPSNKPF